MLWDENGDVHLRQSDISSYLLCPEQYRLKHRGIVQDSESDAALVGTSVHALIEHEGTHGPLSGPDALELAADIYIAEVDRFESEGIPFNRSKFENDDAALKALTRYVGLWHQSSYRDEFLALCEDGELILEWKFDVPLFTYSRRADGEKVNVWVTGTADIVHRGQRVIDWKTAADLRKYAPWERQRWAVQPTVYTYAAWWSELLPDPEWSFQYKVFFAQDKPGEDQSPRTIGVTRNHNHVEWLKLQIGQMLEQEASTVEPWPMRDDHALCSPKWCPAWDGCKGSVISSWN